MAAYDRFDCIIGKNKRHYKRNYEIQTIIDTLGLEMIITTLAS